MKKGLIVLAALLIVASFTVSGHAQGLFNIWPGRHAGVRWWSRSLRSSRSSSLRSPDFLRRVDGNPQKSRLELRGSKSWECLRRQRIDTLCPAYGWVWNRKST